MSRLAFSPKTISFLRALKRNNNRDWFQAHREQYLEHLKAPSEAFLESLAVPLKRAFPDVDVSKRSMFRIYRDTRFSNDKTPYKTHIGFLFRDKVVPEDQGPYIYFGVDPTGFTIGTGVYGFEGTQREHFRTQVTDPRRGAEFRRIVTALRRNQYEVLGKALKKHPIGYEADHANAEYLLYNGCYTHKETDLLKVFYSEKFPEWLVKALLPSRAFFLWMRETARGAPRDQRRFFHREEDHDLGQSLSADQF